MFLLTGEAHYVDVLERTLYNGVLAGVSLAGDTFFYPNPLESDGRYAFNQGALTRKPWFDSSCCPTNIARFIPSVPDYVYAVRGKSLYVNLFVASEARVGRGRRPWRRVTQKTEYPWDGRVELRVDPGRPRAFEVRLRIPGWARDRPVPSGLYRYAGGPGAPHAIRVNGRPVAERLEDGYAVIARTFAPGDVVTLELPMPVAARPRRRARRRRRRQAGARARTARLLRRGCRPRGLGARPRGARRRRASASSAGPSSWAASPCCAGRCGTSRAGPASCVAIPYYAWSHRGPGEMAVWLRRSRGTAGD